MNNSNRRKKLFRKGTGFSKYDSSGRVIYSESINSEGETVFHFYKYDDLGRRIEYKKCYYDIDDREVLQMYTTYIENTIYHEDGSMVVMKCDWGMNDPYKRHYIEEHINPMGRKYCIKYLDTATGHCVIKRYNYDARKYEIIFDGQELFVPYGYPLVYTVK